MTQLLEGAITLASLAVALFFLRFWRETRDALFAAFAVAFALQGLEHAMRVIAGDPSEAHVVYYLVRLVTFATILGAILRKNLERRRAR
jgi:hypothetical protein